MMEKANAFLHRIGCALLVALVASPFAAWAQAPSGTLQATPNPCVIPDGKTVCATTVTWSSTAADAEVWISDTGGNNPNLFARAQSGISAAPWIADHTIRFHLKSGGWSGATLATVDLRGVPASSHVSVTRQYVYDGAHRLCKIIEPETGTTVIGYDAGGIEYWRASGLDLPSTTSCDHLVAWHSGRRVTRSFDARNRLATLTFPDGRGNQAWSYTADGLPATITTWNDAAAGTVTNTYRYNARRALVEETTRQDGFTTTIRYDYNANGHRTLYVTPDALEVRSDVDALGRPLRVYTAWGKAFASGVKYHPNGAVKQFTYGNGIVHTLTQNARQLPERSTSSHGGIAVLDDTYDFDASGNVAAITDGATDRSQRGNRTMGYDGLNRLVSASSPMFGTASYGYDAADRLTRVKVTGGTAARDHTYCYDASHRLTNVKSGGCGGASVIGLGYDVQGNVVNKNGQAFDFDFGNRLRSAIGKDLRLRRARPPRRGVRCCGRSDPVALRRVGPPGLPAGRAADAQRSAHLPRRQLGRPVRVERHHAHDADALPAHRRAWLARRGHR